LLLVQVVLEQLIRQGGPILAAKKKLEVSTDLSPRKYLLICNLREALPGGGSLSHYQEGMVASFLVEP
jgi:hypothetical protein